MGTNRGLRILALTTAIGSVMFLGTGCTASAVSSTSADSPTTDRSTVTTLESTSRTIEAPAPTTSSSASKAGPIVDSAPNGDYIIGTDIAPGVWQCRSGSDSLYWETTDRAGDIVDNDLGSIARVNADAFAVKLKGCEDAWAAVDAEPSAATSIATPEPTSGTGSPTRDADIANCRSAYVKLTDEDRTAFDAAIPIGSISPVTLWNAVAEYRPLAFRSGGTKKIFDAATKFNDAAFTVSAMGVGMSDEVADEFMQSYYELRTFCEDIKAWN